LDAVDARQLALSPTGLRRGRSCHRRKPELHQRARARALSRLRPGFSGSSRSRSRTLGRGGGHGRAVLRQRRASTAPRVFAQVVLGLVRLRRGDPGWEPLLDEAWALAQGTELFRIVPAAAARAEAAWLANDPDGVAAATDPVLALPDGSSAFAVEIAAWRRRAGLDA